MIYFRRKFESYETEHNSKGTYGLLKHQAGWKNGSSPNKFMLNGHIFTAPQDIANIQMKHFQDKVKGLISNLPATDTDPLEHLSRALDKWDRAAARPKFDLKIATEMEVLKALQGIGNSSACGLDGQDSTTLKAIATHIYKPLTHLRNLSIKTKKFPNRWKLAKILPLHKGKQKSKDSQDSFRLISMFCR